jgi:heat shock protein HtpX
MASFYQAIADNKRRSFFIIALFVCFVSVTGYILSYSFDSQVFLPLALAYSAISAFSSYFLGDKIVLSLNQAVVADKKNFFEFYTVTENLAKAASIPMPKIYVIDSPAMNAFATGRSPQHASVCATTGLLRELNRTELEGVIGHELSHIKNYDTLLMTVVSVLLGTVSALINFTNRSSFISYKDDDEYPPRHRQHQDIFQILGVFLLIFAPLISRLIQLAISRRREFFADASSVSLTRQPSGLISALQKIASDSTPFLQASKATDSLYINNPFKGQKLTNLFSTHPPIEDRIAALKKM